jgi:hypothetical protein
MLTIARTDRRMSGHLDFKYRVVFDFGSFRSERTTGLPNYEIAKLVNTAFLNTTEHLTKQFGYGPELELVRLIKDRGDAVPMWAVRHAKSGLHTYSPHTIYLRDEQSCHEFEKILTFLQLKHQD